MEGSGRGIFQCCTAIPAISGRDQCHAGTPVPNMNKDLDPGPPKYEYRRLTIYPRSSMIRERVNVWNAVWIQTASNLTGYSALQDTKSLLSSLEAIVVASFPSRVLGKQVRYLTLYETLRQ